jgi:prepilin-type processing-associated H-X9-DG protein
MYSNENNETFPTGATAMMALNTLYPDYVSERKAFMCPSDNLVTSATNASITANDPFEKDECSYGYDRTHGPADVSGVAIAGDRPTNNSSNVPTDARSPNHGGTVSAISTADVPGYGQNVVYIDGHVEWVASQNAGWADANGNRDNVYTGSGGGTDTYILQDGGLTEEDIALLALIDDSSINSGDLRNDLLAASPLSDSVLNAAINRSDPINSNHLRDVLVNESPLTTGVLQGVVDRNPSMNSNHNRDVLIASSPLPTNILNQVIAGNPPMSSGDLEDVLDEQ